MSLIDKLFLQVLLPNEKFSDSPSIAIGVKTSDMNCLVDDSLASILSCFLCNDWHCFLASEFRRVNASKANLFPLASSARVTVVTLTNPDSWQGRDR